ncbi:MAG: hypothetical protein KDJ69_15295 [Nitratireductor sp.]|nr:hypothetical protein [Nitratireductor sp.]
MDEEQVSEDLIRYDVLTQDALRGVIRKVLDEVAVAGLPGDHHFFITFDTAFPGVRLSKRMRERYPESMTIVIQHTYWDLTVNDGGFEVDLTFNDVRERLSIPFAAIQAFFDPSVKFGLQFDVAIETLESQGENSETASDILPEEMPSDAPLEAPVEMQQKRKSAKKPHAEEEGGAEDGAAAGQPGEVVSLDAFRKKK